MFPTPGTGMGAGFGANAPTGGGGSGQRGVNYKVTVTADTTQANQQLQQLAGTAQQASSATQQASAALNQMRQGGSAVGMGQAGGGAGGSQFNPYQAYLGAYNQYLSKFPGAQPIIQPGAGGAAGKGGGMDFAAGLTKFTAAVAGVTAGLSLLQNTMRTVADFGLQSMSARNKAGSALSRIPLIGGVLQDSGNMLFDVFEQYDSRTGGYGGTRNYNAARDMIANSPFDIGRIQALAGESASLRGMDLERRVAMGDVFGQRSASKQAAGLMFAPNPDAGPYQGRRFDMNDEYDSVIRQAEIARVRATAGVTSARNSLGVYGTESLITRGAVEAGRFGFDSNGAEVKSAIFNVQNDPTANVRPQEVAVNAQKQLVQYTADLQRYQDAVNKSKESSIRLAQQEYDLAQKTIGVKQSELQVLDAKRAKLGGYAEQFGAYDPATQEAVRLATKRASTEGIGSLTSDEKQLLLNTGVTGDYAKGLIRKPTEESDSFRQLVNLVGLEDLKSLEKKRLQLQGEIEFDFKVSADKLYEAIQAAFDKFDPELKKLLGDQVKVKLREIDIKQLENRVQSK